MPGDRKSVLCFDRPLAHYFAYVHSDVRHVRFLCAPVHHCHLLTALREMGISYSFLNVPVEKWSEWEGELEGSKGDD